ncbi:MAG: hypothetical protein WCT77_11640 [Bacteroidota bacterium]
MKVAETNITQEEKKSDDKRLLKVFGIVAGVVIIMKILKIW